MLSAGCAIGCGNVWKFPWMCGSNGGGSFMLLYILCLLVLGLPVMVMEFAVGRAAQASPIYMYQRLEKPGHKWGVFGVFSLIGNIALMAFYTVVTGWIFYYFVKFLTGSNADFGFAQMIADPKVNVTYLFITVLVAFLILSCNLQGGLERVTKGMMIALLVLMLVLAVHSLTFAGAAEGLRFYLVPDFSAIDGSVVVAAMNQAFFSLSVGMGGMAIFGSYIGKDHSLVGESLHVIFLDTFVAVLAGIIIFPACFTYDLEVTAGPSLLFDTMASVFTHIPGGRWWGALFFLFMVFAALSTVLGVCENILTMIRELTGWSRPKGCAVCGVGIFAPGADDGPGLQRAALPAFRPRHRLAGLLGFCCVQQCAAAGQPGTGIVLLQPFWLGMGQFCCRSQHRQGPESAPLDEAHLPLFCTCGDPVHLSVWDVHLYLAVKTGQIGAEFAGSKLWFAAPAQNTIQHILKFKSYFPVTA